MLGLPNMTPNDPGVNAAAILNDAICLAEPHGITNIIADPGTYYLCLTTPPPPDLPYYVVLNDVNGLTIDLQGSSVIVKGIPGNAMAQASALLATNCTALTLRNFSIDDGPYRAASTSGSSFTPAVIGGLARFPVRRSIEGRSRRRGAADLDIGNGRRARRDVRGLAAPERGSPHCHRL